MRPLLVAASAAVGVSTALVIAAVAILPFLTPAWVGFEQARADAAGWTGYAPGQLRTATDSILHDLVLGPPAFDVAIDGQPVLTAAERSHLRDVRGVFARFYLLAAAGLVALAGAAVAARRSSAGWTSARAWRAARAGAAILAIAMVAAGIVVTVAFDAAFEAFHALFFRAGTFDFDPRVYRLTQLFPDAFWSETSLVVGAAILVGSIAVVVVATRRIGTAARLRAGSLAGAA